MMRSKGKAVVAALSGVLLVVAVGVFFKSKVLLDGTAAGQSFEITYWLDYKQDAQYSIHGGMLPRSLFSKKANSIKAPMQSVEIEQKQAKLRLWLEVGTDGRTHISGELDARDMVPHKQRKKSLVKEGKAGAFKAVFDLNHKIVSLDFEASSSAVYRGFISMVLTDLMVKGDQFEGDYPEGTLEAKVYRKKTTAAGEVVNRWFTLLRKPRSSDDKLKLTVSGNGSYSYEGSQLVPSELAIDRESTGSVDGRTAFTTKIVYKLSSKENSSSFFSRKPRLIKGKNYRSVQTMVEKSQDEVLALKVTKGHVFVDDLDLLLKLGVVKDVTELNSLFSRLEAFLLLDSERILALIPIVAQLESDSPVVDLISLLLSSNGSDEAQSALRSMINNEWEDYQKRTQLIRGLAFIKTVNVYTESYAMSLRDRLDYQGADYNKLSYVLGSVAYNSPRESFKKDVIRHIDLNIASNPDLMQVAYVAKGNVAYRPLIKEAKSLLKSKSSHTRRMSLDLIRRISQENDEEIKSTFIDVVTEDSDKNVRRAAANYIQGQHLDENELTQLAQAIQKEGNPNVAMTLISSLGKSSGDHTKKLLMDLYGSCGRPKVCRHIRSVLGAF